MWPTAKRKIVIEDEEEGMVVPLISYRSYLQLTPHDGLHISVTAR